MSEQKKADASETPAERLARLRAERIEREQADEQAAMLDEIAREELQAKADAEFRKREADHGRGRVKLIVMESDGFVIVKVPAPQTYRKFLDTGELENTDNQQNLAKPCIVHSEPAWDKLQTLRPAAITAVANACVELAGVRVARTNTKS